MARSRGNLSIFHTNLFSSSVIVYHHPKYGTFKHLVTFVLVFFMAKAERTNIIMLPLFTCTFTPFLDRRKRFGELCSGPMAVFIF
jgi:hypothetical protein